MQAIIRQTVTDASPTAQANLPIQSPFSRGKRRGLHAANLSRQWRDGGGRGTFSHP